ncbi:GPR endopeptidase [Heliorestis acidaminivorans]|uniref:Germination protease n=1 Tax=Heliorestis acidaminivorans TaxID=553427 RepID=A0A6I0F0I2_9FIRM|nr:GPR endopeptidase [Heliorestis acidaminivorans]KAB2954456.1 GPR endopeptidase [Heliorestis acidaminivorans]
MERSHLYKNLGIQLDMAVEAHDVLQQERQSNIAGVEMYKNKVGHSDITTVKITSPEGEEAMGKPMGNYVTIDAPHMKVNNRDIHQELSGLLAQELSKLLHLGPDDSVLVVGLGNWHATPDALGPKVVNHTMVTRHLHKFAPEELQGGLRSVSAIAPGVLGLTGIETAEIIKGVVEKINPTVIIAIDALATRSVERMATSLQIADTGITPGSGVGNRRVGINKETMGVPVIAIGVPTVVHAGVIAHEAIEMLLQQFHTSPSLYRLYKGLNPDSMQQIIEDVLEPFGRDLIMTPKEIDILIENTSRIIATGLAQALHPSISSSSEGLQYLQ